MAERSEDWTEEASEDKSDAPPAPQFVTASQMRERLGIGDGGHFERVGRNFTAAELTNTGVKDLSPLQGQPITGLVIARNPVTSLDALAGMPLEVLDFSETPVESVEPLAKCESLSQLYLEKTKVSDIAPLVGLPLTRLYLTDCPVKDLKPLAGMNLQELNLCRSNIENLEDLRDVELGILWIRGTVVSDLSPLEGKQLVSLDIEDSHVTDLGPLASIPTLQRLDIAGTDVTDLTPLKGLALTRLIFSPEKITKGIEVVREMPSLREIDTQFEGQQPQPMSASEFWERYDAGTFKSEIDDAS